MGELSAAIIGGAAGIVAAIITGIVTVIGQNRKLNETLRHLGFGEDEASMKRQLDNKLGTSRKSIDEQLGVEGKSISEQLGVGSRSISEQLGVGTKSISDQLGVGIDDCSLTKQHENLSKQHEELKRCISEKNTDIASIASAVHTIEERRNNMSTTQQGVLDTLNAFITNWQELQTRVMHLGLELAQRDETIRSLEAENAELRATIAELEEELEQDSPEE
ncbi:MAG: hypothetical protein ACI4JY_02560 [Oscillospiraceae bacterium]